jgi:hypothetical protein
LSILESLRSFLFTKPKKLSITEGIEVNSETDGPVTVTIQDAFTEFHQTHPEVYENLVELALDMKSKGFESYSIKSLFEVARWHYDTNLRTTAYKLNNSYTSRYSRLIMDHEPELAGFFNVRRLVAA